MDHIVDLALDHKWIGLAALVIGAVVRVLKIDAPPHWLVVPSRWRPILALALGLVAGVLDKVSSGAAWMPAILGGLLAAVTAIASHDVVIEGLRGGKEIGAPKTAAAATLLAFVCAAAASQSGCAWWNGHGARTAHATADVLKCALTHYGEPPEQIAIECGLENAAEVIAIFDVQRQTAQRMGFVPGPGMDAGVDAGAPEAGAACAHQ